MPPLTVLMLHVAVADSAVHRELRLHGNLDKIKTVAQKPSIGNAFEATLGVGLDILGGMAVGADIGEVMGGDAAAPGRVEVCGMDAGGGEGCVPDMGGRDLAEIAPEFDATGGPDAVDAAPGQDLLFVGDEVKYSHDTFRDAKDHFSGGFGKGMARIDELGGKFLDNLPADMKVRRVRRG